MLAHMVIPPAAGHCGTLGAAGPGGPCGQASGTCVHGCEPGWHNQTCSMRCQQGCRGRLCDRESAACLDGCEDGYSQDGVNCIRKWNLSCYM